MRHSLMFWILAAAMLVSLPLTGILLSGHTIRTYLEFPPLTRYVAHATFSWWAFGIIAALNLMMIWGLVVFIIHNRSCMTRTTPDTSHAFPIWGWIGGGIMLIGWWLAWTRFSWFSGLQQHTFCLPWIGYILLVNAWCYQRAGTSLIQQTPGRFLMLFPVSAGFWWFFEFLNRFVQNWYYTGVDDFNPAAYTLFASLAFATVLPAVLSTQRLLLTLPSFGQSPTTTARLKLPYPFFIAVLLLIASAVSLIFLSHFPDYLYPLVWGAPLVVITALQTLWQKPTIFSSVRRGDWRAIVSAAVAALICGFFWEMWNFYSLARWEYSIPFVNRFHVFAMPLLGYGGYLPFGLECLLVGAMVMERHQLGISDRRQWSVNA